MKGLDLGSSLVHKSLDINIFKLHTNKIYLKPFYAIDFDFDLIKQCVLRCELFSIYELGLMSFLFFFLNGKIIVLCKYIYILENHKIFNLLFLTRIHFP
jgi:hypothetical protein